jgi:tight adherence protein C
MELAIFASLIFSYLFFALFLLERKKYNERRQEVRAYLREAAASYPFTPAPSRPGFRVKLFSRMLRYADDFSGIGHRINFFSEPDDVEKWLQQAGYPYQLTVERLQGLKIFTALLGFVAGIFFFVLGFPFSQVGILLLPLGGYFSAILWIRQKAKARQAELAYALPDFLDTMSVTLKAGVSMDQAMREIIRYFEGPLKEEFTRFLQETDLGMPREAAYRNLLRRNDNPGFQTVIKSLIQGERLGVPVSSTFKAQAEDMRKLRREKIKEQAAKASPKITLITTFVVMPSAMLLIGGLMILHMFTGDNNLFSLFK